MDDPIVTEVLMRIHKEFAELDDGPVQPFGPYPRIDLELEGGTMVVGHASDEAPAVEIIVRRLA